ncbi:MAG: WYL domain-containing protein [Prevotella sp.]|nr:WYL domain-containing protein [Prevotella sp.]
MRHDKLGKELELVLLLADTEDYSVDEICERVMLSRRNFYYYLHFLRDSGFIVFKRNNSYHVDQRSPFLNRLLHLLQFTEDEAVTVRRLLDMAGDTNPIVNSLRYKLDRFYDFSILNDPDMRKKAAKKVNTLYEAIKWKQVVKLVGYSSPHSQTVTDRFVEPFLFMNNNNDIRCYEVLSHSCKTFRISRMQDVELIDLKWSHEQDHVRMFTDIFMFSGTEHLPVRVRMGQLARNVFVEEYPAGQKYLASDDETHWILELEVCDYRGIGRFVLGLFEDIEVLGDARFYQYISEKVVKMQMKHT